jgi:hypothetical protein
MFARVPVTFWDDPQNRRRYLRWLGQRLRFKNRSDWRRIRRHHFLENCGGGLLAQYASYLDLLKEYAPPGKAASAKKKPKRSVSSRR